MRRVFVGALRSAGGLSLISPSTPLPQHWEPKNDIEFENFSKFFSELSSYPLNSHIKAPKTTSRLAFFSKSLLLLYRNIQSQKVNTAFKKTCFISHPLQQHRRPKNDTVFQKIFLLYNRSLHPSKNDIQFCFLEIFLYYLNNIIEGLENDSELQLYQKIPLLSYRNIERRLFNTRSKKDF